MRTIAALLDSRAALGSLRRSLPRGAAPVLACRSAKGLELALAARLLEVIVLGTEAARQLPLSALRARFPHIPVVIYGVVRSDDAEQVLGWQRLDVPAVVLEGVDDAVVGDLVIRRSVSARRAATLADAPRMLRLQEPLQRQTWELLVARLGRPPRTASVARALGVSREHLSRQFGAGGAPNLKRVADFLTVHSALGMLRNPGYTAPSVAGLLAFTSSSHLRATVQRVIGIKLEDARELEAPELLRRFVRVSAKSRS